jgi:hypothetical protein
MAETRISSRLSLLLPVGLLSALLWAAPVKLDGSLGSPPPAAAVAQTPTAAIEGELAMEDIGKAIDDIRGVSGFFARLAENDPNLYAARLWSDLRDSYAGIARRLTVLLEQGRIRVGRLSGGNQSLVDGGTIVVDRGLGGRWLPRFVRSARRSGDDWQYISLLSTVLLQDLLSLEPDAGRVWFRKHLARSKLAAHFPPDEDPRLTRHLAGFWHIKDKRGR